MYLNTFTLKITEGSMYVYEILSNNSSLDNNLSNFIFEIHIKSLNPFLNASNFNYLMTVQKDYWKAVNSWNNAIRWSFVNGSTYITIGKSEYDLSEAGIVVCKRIYVVVRVSKVESDRMIVNVTLSMNGGYARFGLRFSPLPVTDSGWSVENGSYISHFNFLNMSKTLIINKNNHNTKDLTGFNLGEWPFWLKNTKSKYEAILYGLDDHSLFLDSNLTFSGKARIMLLNMSKSSPSKFLINNINIKSEDQIYSDNWFLPLEEKILNVTSEEKDYIINSIKNLYDTSEAKVSLSSIIPLTMEYRNNSIILFKDIIPKFVNLTSKPWIYIKDAGTIKSNYDSQHQIIYITRGIEYDKLKYFTVGFPDLKNISYERSNKLLLYITVKTDFLGSLDSILPSVIVRAFGLVGFEITRYSEVSMKLVKYMSGGNTLLSFINTISLDNIFITIILVNDKTIKKSIKNK